MKRSSREPLVISLAVIGSVCLMVYTVFCVSLGGGAASRVPEAARPILSTITPSSQLAQAGGDITTGLVAHYKFDESSGTTAADSAGGPNATLSAGATFGTGLVGSGSLALNGSSHVSSPFNPSTLTSFTIAFWANPSSMIQQRFFSAADSGSSRFYLGPIANGSTQIILGLGSWNPAINSGVSASQWQHYALVLNGTTGTLYRNGTNISSQAGITVSNPNTSLKIGSQTDGSLSFNGNLDDFRIYSRALTSADVSALYALGGGSGPPASFTLTVTKSGTGSGTVTGGTINCGSTCTMTGSGSITLTAAPATGSAFNTWGGACSGTSTTCTVTLSQNLTVSATFDDTSGGGGGGPPDTTPPTMSEVSSAGITSTSATINWTTNEAADSQVLYGLTSAYGSNSAANSSLVTSHSVNLSSLVASTVYHYAVKSADAAGNVAQSPDATFTTLTPNNGPDINAASCELVDVQAAYNQAHDGDTIHIPAGRCTWTAPLIISKGITLRGADIANGVWPTVLLNNNHNANQRYEIIQLSTAAGKSYRVSSIEIQDGDIGNSRNNSDTDNNSIVIYGNSTAVRIDHCRFYEIYTIGGIYVVGSYGVIDHNKFDLNFRVHGITFDNGNMYPGSTTFGDGSWHNDVDWGGSTAMFVEDNVFNKDGTSGASKMFDAFDGAKIVFRFNNLTNSGIGNHGTETTQRYRSGRSMEVYNNTLRFTPGASSMDALMDIRGGGATIFNNSFTSGGGNSNINGSFVKLNSYRTFFSAKPWGQVDGTKLWDGADTSDGPESPGGAADGVFEAGTATGGGTDTITDSAKTWTANQWYGYTFRQAEPFIATGGGVGTVTVAGAGWANNQWSEYEFTNVTTHQKSFVDSNNSTTLYLDSSFETINMSSGGPIVLSRAAQINSNTPTSLTLMGNSGFGSPRVFRAGQHYEIRRASFSLDSPGRGRSDLPDGSSPLKNQDLRQVSDPVYQWNNTYNGNTNPTSPVMIGNSGYASIKQNRDFYSGFCRPGYTPYTYPHPLVQQQDGVPPQTIDLHCSGGTPPQNYTLTVTKTGSGYVSGAGISCGSTCSYYGNGPVTLFATPSSGATFTGWGGACSGTSSCVLNLSSNITVSAAFTAGQPGTKTLTVSKAGTGTGTVTGGTINCGSTCSQTSNTGTSVTLTAVPASGSTFTSWTVSPTASGACTTSTSCTVTLNADTTITATFTLAQAGSKTLTVTKGGTGTGTVTGGNINCGSTCTQSVTTGSSVTLTASPSGGSTFTSWTVSPTASGACTTATSCTVTLNADTTITATFTLVNNQTPDVTPPTVNITAPTQGTTVSGSTVTLSANATDPTSPSGSLTSGMGTVQFKLDGNNVGSAISSPYGGYWDTTPVANGDHIITALATDLAGNHTTSATVTVTVNNVALTPDVTKPSIPQGLSATAASPYQVNLTWSASTDPAVSGALTSGVSGYKIYLNGSSFTTVSGTSYSHTSLTPQTTYSYAIFAYDGAGNLSDQSSSVSATTPVAPPQEPPPLLLSEGAPWQELPPGTRSATLMVRTNRNATCEYSTRANVPYGQGTRFSTTGSLHHEATLTSLRDATTYTSYVVCEDANGTRSLGSYLISFSVGRAPTVTAPTRVVPGSTGTFTPTRKATRPTGVKPVVGTSKPFTLTLDLKSWEWVFGLFATTKDTLWAIFGL